MYAMHHCLATLYPVFIRKNDDPEMGKIIYLSPVPSKPLLSRHSDMIHDSIAVFTFYGFFCVSTIAFLCVSEIS